MSLSQSRLLRYWKSQLIPTTLGFRAGTRRTSLSCAKSKGECVNTITENDLKKFWPKVNKRGPECVHPTLGNIGKCWDWIAGFSNTGYGSFRIFDATNNSHKVSWMIHFGEVPEGLEVCHKCDRRKCVNPQHLFIGTRLQNVLDMSRKNRNDKDDEHWNCKIQKSELPVIFEMKIQGATQHEMARKFGVTQGHISDILAGRRRVTSPVFQKPQ